MELSLFSVYNLKVEYPSDWRVKLKDNSSRARGHVAFLASNGSSGIFITWGELHEAKKRFKDSREQAENSLKKMMKERPYGEEGLKILDQRELEVGGHKGFMNHMHLKSLRFGVIPLFARPRLRDIYAVFLHCDESQRFFVIVGDFEPNELDDPWKNLNYYLNSFDCHLKVRVKP
ncbi:MAG: hypothetical protein QXR65_09420 [Candidatus Bathyarchaeia archaeon]|nr:hypothetical protein [Candidatus Bathyarchaeota archaeon]